MDGNKKYLAFNSQGIIYSLDQSTHSNVSVEFHDKSIRPIHFTDPNNFDKACLGTSGALFSSEVSGIHPSTIFFKPLDGWASKGDWSIQMGVNESAKALALTGQGAVVATDQHLLRFFSFSGIQTFIKSLNGPIVGMAGSQKHLLVIYNAGAVFHSM